MTAPPILYHPEPAEGLIIEPLDAMTLVYHRRSGVTHMVAEPVPEILAVMGDDRLSAQDIVKRLGERFELQDSDDALESVNARLEELAALGLVHRVPRDA